MDDTLNDLDAASRTATKTFGTLKTKVVCNYVCPHGMVDQSDLGPVVGAGSTVFSRLAISLSVEHVIRNK